MSIQLIRSIGLSLIIFLCCVFLMLWFSDADSKVMVLAAIYTVIFAISSVGLKVEMKSWLAVAYVTLQLGIATAIIILDGTFISQIYLFILLGEVTLQYSLRYGIAVSLLCYFSFVIGNWIHYDYPSLSEISYIFPRLFEYATFFGFSYLAKIAFRQKQELTVAYERLAEFSVGLEQKTVLQERTRLSREIHDTVGHTLTSAITGLQTAIRFFHNDKALSMDMMEQTKEHIQRGLEDVRRSVHALEEDVGFPDFISAIVSLIDETERQTGVVIERQIDPNFPRLLAKIEMVFYRALQEGLTNGIRHGQSTHFTFSLLLENDSIMFKIVDNGSGWRGQPFGFGLSAMKSRVADIGGSLHVKAGESKRGTVIVIELPFKSTKERGASVG